MAVSHREEIVMFGAKKIVIEISNQTITNKRQKNFEDKIKNFVKMRVNTSYF